MPALDIPRVACEIAPERVIAGRANDTGTAIDVLSERRLPPGALGPGLANANLARPAAVRGAVTDAFAAVSGRRRDVVVIWPHASVRSVWLKSESLPEK